MASTESPLVFGRWMIPDTERAAASLFHLIRAAEVVQPEQVVGRSWERFQVRPRGSFMPSATKAVALAASESGMHTLTWVTRPFLSNCHPAQVRANDERAWQGSGSSFSVPQRRVVRTNRLRRIELSACKSEGLARA